MTAYGMVTHVTNKPPPREALARNVDYERHSSDGIGQDHLLGLPEVQQDGQGRSRR